MRKIIQLSKINNRVLQSLRVKMAHGEFNRPLVKLEPVFYDGFFEIKNKASDNGATFEPKQDGSERKKNFWNSKNFFRIIFTGLCSEVVHPPF